MNPPSGASPYERGSHDAAARAALKASSSEREERIKLHLDADVERLRAQTQTLATWLETVLWHVNNPNRAGEGMNIGDATRALHDFSPEAAHRVNPGLASLYDELKAS